MLTTILVAITCIISFIAFSNESLRSKLIFYPYEIKENNQWYRFFAGGFIHADSTHLIFNMISLYSIGTIVERQFVSEFGEIGRALYVGMYLAAIPLSSLFDYYKHRDNINYRALGASGAVSAVIYSGVLFFPWSKIIIFFAIPMWFWLFGILYLGFSAYMAKRGGDNVGHYAHFFGGIIGFVFPIVMKPELAIQFYNTIITHSII
jgi:membrane associated rhomboid family serine protease